MIVNMYVDHLLATQPATAVDVWQATRTHPKTFRDAADRIGLSPAEYSEFRTALLDGKAAYVKLPRRVDAMSGSRRGSVYAVRNAVMTSTVMGWRVALGDGNVVYVPQICGNISVVHPIHVAVKPLVRTPRVAHARYAFHPALAQVPKETPVVMEAPASETPVELPSAAPVAAAVAPAGGGRAGGFFFAIPAIIGGIIAGGSHNGHSDTPPPAAPPCSSGSNVQGVCQGK